MNSKTVNFIKIFITSFLIFIILTILSAFIVLKNGITIQSLQIGGVKVEQLYLKLDNKLQLGVDTISITPSDSQSTLATYYIIEAIEYFPLLFERVDIKSLQLTQGGFDFDLQISFANDIFQIDSNRFYLYSSVRQVDKQKIIANPVIYLKEYDIYLFSQLHIHLDNNTAEAKTDFHWHDAQGSIIITRDAKDIDISITSQSFQNLEDIFINFNLHPIINAWTYEYITAQDYTLEYLNFHHRLGEPFNLYNLKGKAVANNVKVKFDPEVPIVSIDEVTLFFEDGKLLFDLENPIYEDKSIDGSFVYIGDLLNDEADYIIIDIKATTKYDKSIKTILDAYGIDILVTQDSGEVDANVIVKIFLATGEVEAKGEFFTQDAVIDLLGYKLPTKDARVSFLNDRVNLQHIHIFDENQDLYATGVIDTTNKMIDLTIDAKSYSKYYTNIKDLNFDVDIDYNESVIVKVPIFNTVVVVDEDVKIEIERVENLMQYLLPIPVEIKGGTLQASSSDFINYQINAQITADQNYLQSYHFIENFLVNAQFNINTEQLILSIEDKLLYNRHKNELSLNYWDLNLTPFIDSDAIDLEELKKSNIKLSLFGNNSALFINDHKLVSNHYDLHIDEGKIKLHSKLNDSNVEFSLIDGQIKFQGQKLNDFVLHPLLNFNGVVGGEYDLIIEGTPENLIGKLDIKGGLVTNMKSYNNLIALINTIPALALFQNPGFNEKGMDINHGSVEFIVVGNFIYITKLFINGKSANIEGAGYIDLENEKIDLDLKIKTIREVGQVIGSIPIAGYIIFGEDKSLTFTAKVEGSLSDPQVRTQTASKIITTPLNMMLRTIESPFRLLRDIFTPKSQE